MSLQPGDLLQNRYRVVRIIQSGGMGSVYEAQDVNLADSPCAVKEIHQAALSSRDSEYIQARFYEEMKALVSLDHPAIPKVRDYLTIDNVIFIVMELVQGHSLSQEIEQRAGQPAHADHAVLDTIRLLETLDYLHRQNPPIIHRDVKPANILRDQRTGQIKLVDFGLARKLEGEQTQTVVGTMGYCAPEQLMGKSEERSDIYAVGVTLHHLLTGIAPQIELFDARRPDLPGLRAGLEEIIEKATQPKPSERYPSALAMAQDLKNWLHGGEAAPQPMVHGAPTTRLMPATAAAANPPLWTRTRVAVAAAGLLGAVALGVGLGGDHAQPSTALVPTSTPAAAAAKPKPKPVATRAAKPKPKPPAAAAAPPQPAERVASAPPPPRPAADPFEARTSPPPPVQAARPAPVQVAHPAPGPRHHGRPQRVYQQPHYQPPPPPQPRYQDYGAAVEQQVRQEARNQVRQQLPREVRNIPLPF